MEKSKDANMRSCLGCLQLGKLLPTFTSITRSKTGKKSISKKEETMTLGAARCDYNIHDIVPSIKRLSGSSDSGGGGFKYDTVSYAHNFDDGQGGDDYDEDNVGRRFSSRYAVSTPSSAYSKSVGNGMGIVKY